MFFTKPKELGGRRGIPTHYILRAKDVCWLLFIGLKLLPWASIILWYLFFVCACPSIKLRKGMLRDVCAAPFQGQHAEDEWYQDFWNVKHAPKYIGTRNSSRTYLQVLMVGHLQLRDSMRALNDQARQAALQTPDLFTQEMQSDLSTETYLLSYSEDANFVSCRRSHIVFRQSCSVLGELFPYLLRREGQLEPCIPLICERIHPCNSPLGLRGNIVGVLSPGTLLVLQFARRELLHSYLLAS